MHIHCIRHPEPNIAKGICYGQTDLAANMPDHQVVDGLILQLQEYEKDLSAFTFFSSPMKRCAQFAKLLTPNQAVHFDTNIQEISFGDWEMQTWESIPQQQLTEWANNIATFAPPNGESFTSLIHRCEHFYTHSLKPSTVQNNVLITHAGVIKAFHVIFGHSSIEEAATIHSPYCSLTSFSL